MNHPWSTHMLMPSPKILTDLAEAPPTLIQARVSQILQRCALAVAGGIDDRSVNFFTGDHLHYLASVDSQFVYGLNQSLIERIIPRDESARDGYIFELLAYSFRDPMATAALTSFGRDAPAFISNAHSINEDRLAMEVYGNYPDAFPGREHSPR